MVGFAVIVALALVLLLLPAGTKEVASPATQLDRFVAQWQFREKHSLALAAPPERVYQAIKQLRADEIFLFRTLTWIRRAGRTMPPHILNPGSTRPLLEVATTTGFTWLADDPPRELVIGMMVIAPPGSRASFEGALAPGHAKAVMNFLLIPNGNGTMVSTETRVFASDDRSRRAFAAYWRVIYPGSAFLRRMWLRAIRRRALS